uniref:Glutathione S-transferase T3 n=1 Tax=Noccaea caerulescens TaxID=107243 RepID=A0A1J3HEG1_NOCCA
MGSNYVGLLNSQQDPLLSHPFSYDSFPSPSSVELGSSQVPPGFSQCTQEASVSEVNALKRQKWTPSDDILLISAWLNTSKDPVVGNEQKLGTFWKRIVDYIAPTQRTPCQCKQRWHKITGLVSKFCGSYDAATRSKSSGQNDDDVLRVAHELYFNDYKARFNLEHAWKQLNDVVL